MKLPPSVRARLESRRLPAWAALFAAAIGAPTLGAGLAIDDWLMRVKSLGYGPATGFSPFDLFAFLTGDPAEVRRWASIGLIPWFTSPLLRFRFLRPLASISHYLDYATLHAPPWAMHAENVALFAIACALAAKLYRRLAGPTLAAGLAASLFLLDDAHGIALGWISNRNTLFAMVFALGALLAHDAWRRSAWRAGALVGPLCFAAGLASAELALGTAGYLAAYALALDDAPWRRRVAALAPYAGVLASWAAAYVATGSGASYSGMYVDPLHEPRVFLALFPRRFAALALGELGFPPADAWIVLHRVDGPAAIPLAAVFFAAFGWLVLPLLRADRTARFFALGTAASLLPATATIASDRLLMLASIGGAGLLALTIVSVLAPGSATGARRGARAFATALLVVHGVLAPVGLAATSQLFGVFGRTMDAWRAQIDLGPHTADRTLVVLNAPISFVAYAWFVPRSADDVVPRRGAILSVSTVPVTVTRRDSHTLSVRPDAGFVDEFTTQLFRSRRLASALGDVSTFEFFSATVDEVDAEGVPLAASFRFDVPLDDASIAFVSWNGARWVRYEPPAVGAREVVATGPWP